MALSLLHNFIISNNAGEIVQHTGAEDALAHHAALRVISVRGASNPAHQTSRMNTGRV